MRWMLGYLSLVLLDGNLQLYEHHVTAPKAQRECPAHHMVSVGAFSLFHSRGSFVESATAPRDAPQTACRLRTKFVQLTNARAKGLGDTERLAAINAENLHDPSGVSFLRASKRCCL